MERRNFIASATCLGWIANTAPIPITPRPIKNDRTYWLAMMKKIADPVLVPMSKGLLRKTMPIDVSPSWDGRDKQVAYMEAFGRLIAGITPFLALPLDDTEEGRMRSTMLLQTQQCLAHAVDPESPDQLYWGSPKDRQPLVDAAFMAQALLAAPQALWTPLDAITKARYIASFKKMRQIKPYNSNWLLFAAIIESFLLFIGEDIDATRIDQALEAMKKWYVGDGWYSDGDTFHFDYYNGFVMHPMYVQVLQVNVAKNRRPPTELEIAYKRMKRYAYQLERMVSPEGTFPIFGRSATYRMGCFQPLTQLALEHALPEGITPSQVRAAMTAVMKKVFVKESFNDQGYLTLGVVGNAQSGMSDAYSNTGSMYLTAYAFLPLGLSASDPFWQDPAAPWTQQKVWSGQPFERDHAIPL